MEKEITRNNYKNILLDYYKRIAGNEFTVDDVEMFLKCVKFEFHLTGISPLLYRPNVRRTIAQYFNCNEEDVYIGNYDLNDLNFGDKKFPYKCIIGSFYCDQLESFDIDNLEYVCGGALFSGANEIHLKNIRYVGGDLTLSSRIKSVGKLEEVGGSIAYMSSHVANISELKTRIEKYNTINCNSKLRRLYKMKKFLYNLKNNSFCVNELYINSVVDSVYKKVKNKVR